MNLIKIIKYFTISLILIIFVKTVEGEVYTALTDLEECLETEAALISNLKNYIELQENKLEYLKQKVLEYQKEHNDAANDVQAYLSNPINAYRLVKRLSSDWRESENFMQYDITEEIVKNITTIRETMKFPADEDLNGAAVALTRLQDTYNLDTSSIARGELNGIQYSTEMSLSDCFELGRQSYVNGDYYHTVLWMNEAMDKFGTEQQNHTKKISVAEILEYLAFSSYKQGNVLTALQLNQKLLEINPQHERALGNQVYYEKEAAELKETEGKSSLKVKGDDGSNNVVVSQFPVHIDTHTTDLTERQKYEQLCRGELHLNATQSRSLNCRYVKNKSPFTLIAPFKLEVVSSDPFIGIFHDVLFDKEIELVKEMARPRLKRATVQNSVTGALETANYRISKSSWIKTEEHPIIENIVKRIEDFTNLNMETAEELQVVNYGIGGHYEPHFDFARREEKNAFQSLGTGNRIATVLFYMSDVEQGGATVFPHIDVALWPKKGAAAFWYNLYADGEGDYRTRHAACPVLTGSKWVSNKWIHERGQEFRRPCELEPDHFPWE